MKRKSNRVDQCWKNKGKKKKRRKRMVMKTRKKGSWGKTQQAQKNDWK